MRRARALAPSFDPLSRTRKRVLRQRVGAVAVAVVVTALCLGAVARSAAAGPVTSGIWLTLSQIQALPQSGAAWIQLKTAADGGLGSAQISDINSNHDVKTLAVALAYARTQKDTYRRKATDAIMAAIGTESSGDTLALGRNLVSYVIAADLINLREYSPSQEATFRAWLQAVRTEWLGGTSLVATN